MPTKNLTVVSPAYFTDLRSCQVLSDSCRILKLPLHLYGVGEPWPWLRQAKIVDLRREIEKVDSKYVLVSDSSDVVLLGNEDEIINKFKSRRCFIFMSAEKNCWPQPLMANCYPKIQSPWCYLNSGSYIGRKEDVLEMLRIASQIRPNSQNYYNSRDWENDQFLLAHLYIDNYGITLDTQCDLFQTMGDTREHEVDFEGVRLINKVMKSCPTVIHFNGHTKGLKDSYNKRFGESVCG